MWCAFFSPSLWLISSFSLQCLSKSKSYLFWWSLSDHFFFYRCAYLRILCLTQDHKDFLLYFLVEVLLVLGSVFQSDPSCVNFYGEKYRSKVWFGFACGYLIIPAPFVEKLLFLHWIAFASFLKISDRIGVGLFLESFLCHWSICLSLLFSQYVTMLDTVALE